MEEMKKEESKNPLSESAVSELIIGLLPGLVAAAAGGPQAGAMASQLGASSLSRFQEAQKEEKKSKAEAEKEEKKLGLEERKLAAAEKQAQSDTELKKLAQQAKTASEGEEKAIKQFELTQKLRQERNSLPVTRATQEVSTGYQKILGASPTAAGDMSLIFGYMKMQDPGSTVREGEYATAEQARGVSDKVIALYNKAKDGQLLTPEQRKDFINQAHSVFAAQSRLQEKVDSQYIDIAKQGGIDPKYVTVGFDAGSFVPQQEQMAKQPGFSVGNQAYAAPPVPDFSKMSDEELDKILGGR